MTSIQGMWWAVQTLTSLGYGDFPVETIPGKLIGRPGLLISHKIDLKVRRCDKRFQ